MMEGWQKVILEDLGFVGRGKSRHRPRNAAFLYSDKYPFVQTADVKSANNKISKYSQMYSEEGLKQSKLWPKNTLCITIAANIADAAILDLDACFPDSVIGFIPDSKKSDVQFVKYLFDILQVSIKQISQGAAQDNLSLEKLRSINFLVPPLPTQRKIANILSAYDDLIENNLKRIKLLEEMAQITYEEWFVRMKFPGHETAVFDKETGLPEGWKKVKIKDIAVFQNGYAFYTKGYSNEGFPVIDLGNISEYSDLQISGNEKLISKELYDKSKKFQLKKNDIVMAMTDVTSALRILAKSGIIHKNDTYVLNQRVGMLRPAIKEIDYVFLYALLNDPRLIGKMKAVSKGAVQFYFNTKDIVNYVSFLPSKPIIIEFIKIYKPLIELRMKLKKENQRLKEARDILLPRLMTGMIDVDKMSESGFAGLGDEQD